jgi:hypothetical protein
MRDAAFWVKAPFVAKERMFMKLLLAALFPVALLAPDAGAAPSCIRREFEIWKKNDPQSYAVYVKAPAEFHRQTMCSIGMPYVALFGALHETVHHIDNTAFLYFLDNGKKIPWPEETYLSPLVIAPEVRDDPAYDPYLTDSGGSFKYFHTFLDELNGYTREVISAARVYPKLKPPFGGVNTRDRQVSMMRFLKVYLNRLAQTRHWDKFKADRQNTDAVRELWNQAEYSLQLSCPIPSLSHDGGRSIKRVYSEEKMKGLAEILGRSPAMPEECRTGKSSGAKPKPKQDPPRSGKASYESFWETAMELESENVD